MKTKLKILALVGVLAAAAILLGSCYAPLAGQKGHFNLNLKFAQSKGTTANVLVLVIDSDYQASLAETLWLISKGTAVGLSSTEADRLTELGKEISTNALVRFGGFPFYQTTIGLPTGSFDIPGVPADKSYFVKFFVLNDGVTFEIKNLDQNFLKDLVQSESYAFTNNDGYGGGGTSATFDNSGWIPAVGQPVTVNSGESVPLSVTVGAIF
jgi:hypothetical protein